jgi:mutator protein MutT
MVAAPHANRVVAAVIEQAGRFLVARRPVHKHHGGLWEFPGGKVAAEESLREALARELAEELAVRLVACGECLHVEHDPRSGLAIHFIAAEIADEPQALEHSALAWLTPAALATLPLAPADARFASAVLAVRHDAPLA